MFDSYDVPHKGIEKVFLPFQFNISYNKGKTALYREPQLYNSV